MFYGPLPSNEPRTHNIFSSGSGREQFVLMDKLALCLKSFAGQFGGN